MPGWSGGPASAHEACWAAVPVCARAVRMPRLLCSGPPGPSHRTVRPLPLHGVCVVGVMQVWASSPKACWSPAASGREAVPLAALHWPDSWAGTWAAAQPPVPSLGTRVPGWQREGFGWTRHSLPPTRGCRLPPRSDCGASAETGLLESALGEMCAGELQLVCQALEVPGAELCVSDISWCMECVLLRGDGRLGPWFSL